MVFRTVNYKSESLNKVILSAPRYNLISKSNDYFTNALFTMASHAHLQFPASSSCSIFTRW